MTVMPRIISKKRQPTTSFATPKGFPKILNTRPNPKTFAPRAPSAPTTPFTPTPSSAAAIGTPAPTIPQSDPRDAQYFNDVAKLDQYYSSQKSNLTASGEELARNLTKNNSLLAEQQPKDELTSKQNANKSGLFYSGALGKNLGDIATSYARRRSDLQTEFESGKSKIDRSLTDLTANYGPTGLMRNDVLQAGIARAAALDQQNAMALAASQSAAQGAAAPVPSAAPAAAPAGALPYRTQAGTSQKGVPGVWHIYPGGRKVFVAKR
jgi:hypothetical protein